jgi:spore germination protein YaaH
VKKFVDAAHAAKVKVGAAFGGAPTINDPGVFGSLLNDGSRAGFVQKISDFLDANNLDGIDVDLEGNSVDGRYEAFAKALKDKLVPRGKFVTAAVARWFAEKGSVAPSAWSHFDFLNVMAYDLCNWSTPNACDVASYGASKAEIEWWANDRKIPKAKLVLGVPFYAHRWGNGENGKAYLYSEILKMYGADAAKDEIYKDGYTVFHNGRATIQNKARLAKDFGGIMVWEVGQDATGNDSLFKAIVEAL